MVSILKKNPHVKLFVTFLLMMIVYLGFSASISPLPPFGDLIHPSGRLWNAAKTADPSGEITVDFKSEYLKNEVTVYYDEWGVPHIYAKTKTDLYFAMGYLQAKDRLFELDFQRRLMYGELSEVFGPATLDLDKEFRFLGIGRLAEKSMTHYRERSKIDPRYAQIVNELEAYAAGVNAYISSLGDDPPFEMVILNYRPEPWKPEYTAAFAYFMSWILTLDYYDLVAEQLADEIEAQYGLAAFFELFPMQQNLQVYVVPGYGNDSWPLNRSTSDQDEKLESVNRDLLDVALRQLEEARKAEIASTLQNVLLLMKRWNQEIKPPQKSMIGSNNWVVGPDKTASGEVILMNDMHLLWTFPHIWYEVHQTIKDDDISLYGYALVGVPYIISGHNQHVAWGFTNVAADFVDMYFYKWKDTSHEEYWYDDQWQAVQQRVETINVRGKDPVQYVINETVHGPLFEDDNGRPLALRWAAAKNSTVVLALQTFNYATNWKEFRKGLDLFDTPPQNIVYGDKDGNFGITAAGHYPIRRTLDTNESWLPIFPVNGSAGRYEWVDFIDTYEEMPHTLNPSQGYAASANQRTAGASYPYFISIFQDDGYRARRINEFLRKGNNFTMEDMKRLQLDIVDTAARSFLGMLLEDVQGREDQLSSAAKTAIDLIKNWDVTMDKDETAPLIWAFFRDVLRDEVFGDEWRQIGAEDLPYPQLVTLEYISLTNASSRWFDDIFTTDKVETRADIFIRALEHGVQNLIRVFGNEWSSKKWGDYHFLQITHITGADSPFNVLVPQPQPLDGSWATVNVAPDMANHPGEDTAVYSRVGPSERIIIDFSDLSNSLSSIPTGNSGNPFSKHWDDQFDRHLNGKYHKQYFYLNELDLQANVGKIEVIWYLRPKS